MKVIIAGSREGFVQNDVIEAIFQSGWRDEITEVVSGTARGVDTLGEVWAKNNNINIKRFPANWDLYGKSAGHRRNRDMGDYADSLIALWNGSSKGTKGMIDYMKHLGKPVYIYTGG